MQQKKKSSSLACYAVSDYMEICMKYFPFWAPCFFFLSRMALRSPFISNGCFAK